MESVAVRVGTPVIFLFILRILLKSKPIEILLVEDNMFDAEMTIRALKKNNKNYIITHQINGAEALNYIFGKGLYEGKGITKPGLILLDLKMPKIDGIQVLEKMKVNSTTKDIPVVILTSSNRSDDIDKITALGASGFIQKSLAFKDFLTALSSLGSFLLPE
jgi:two-component system response regulator